jgi:hypothetical protein
MNAHLMPQARSLVEALGLSALSLAIDQGVNESVPKKSYGVPLRTKRIYWRLKSYVDAAADYEPRTKFDLDATTIQAKMILLAVPEYTSPTQWRYVFAALRYGGERGVSIVITRIRE